MSIHVIPGRAYDSNIYVITGENPTIIDTGTGQNQSHVHTAIQSIIDPSSVTQIILTHEHFDHIGGTEAMLNQIQHDTTIISHPQAKEKIEDGKSMFAKMLGATMPKIMINKTVNENDTLLIGDDSYTVIHTPGHTPGCICLYCEKTKTLFSGDTIFSHGSFGRTDFPGGSTEQLINSIKRLNDLDVEQLYPGHEAVIQDGGNDHISLSLKNILSCF
jgi:glyoxylase-like metal-dependent hydrolase (beta-lactamase superfamily II)